jgi:hypothetical protein
MSTLRANQTCDEFSVSAIVSNRDLKSLSLCPLLSLSYA